MKDKFDFNKGVQFTSIPGIRNIDSDAFNILEKCLGAGPFWSAGEWEHSVTAGGRSLPGSQAQVRYTWTDR